MISVDTAAAFAIRVRSVADQIGESLSNDLVVSDPYVRRIVGFGLEFLTNRNSLPRSGDWEVWLGSLHEGVERDGTREALSRLLAQDLTGHDPDYFAEQVGGHLAAAAARTARARLNSMDDVSPDAILDMARRVEASMPSAMSTFARLEDVNTWATRPREDDLIPTGIPSLDRAIGGWGKELWIVFADSAVGKSMLLQCLATSIALRGRNVLHVTLELGIRSQIYRYYRQIAQAHRQEFASSLPDVKDRLNHWFKFAHGRIRLVEYPAYSLDPPTLRRTVERARRSLGEDIHVVILDYLDLMVLPKDDRTRSTYDDLGKLTHQVRSLCPSHDLGIITASQAVRRPANPGKLTIKDMGDSYHKIRGADGVISLVRTPEEEEVHQGRIGVLKARDSGARNMEIPVYINGDLAYIAELGHPNTAQLMKRLGHA